MSMLPKIAIISLPLFACGCSGNDAADVANFMNLGAGIAAVGTRNTALLNEATANVARNCMYFPDADTCR